MKIKFVKILTSLFLSITSVMCFTHNVNAVKDSCDNVVRVDISQFNLSPKNLANLHYLNSPQIKGYLVQCLEQSGFISADEIYEIKSKFDRIGFFYLPKSIYDSKGRPILRLWVPSDKYEDHNSGTLYFIPLEYATR